MVQNAKKTPQHALQLFGKVAMKSDILGCNNPHKNQGNTGGICVEALSSSLGTIASGNVSTVCQSSDMSLCPENMVISFTHIAI